MDFIGLLSAITGTANKAYTQLKQQTAVQEYHNAINAWSRAKSEWYQSFIENPYKINPQTERPYYEEALNNFDEEVNSFKQYMSNKFLTEEGKAQFEDYMAKDVISQKNNIFQQAIKLHQAKLRYDFGVNSNEYVQKGDKEGLYNYVMQAQQTGTISDIEATQALDDGFLNIALREKSLKLDRLPLEQAYLFMGDPKNWTYTNYDGTTKEIPLDKREQFQKIYTEKVKNMDSALYMEGLSMFSTPLNQRLSPNEMRAELQKLAEKGLGRANESHYKILVDMINAYERRNLEKATGQNLDSKRFAFENRVITEARALQKKGYTWEQIQPTLESYFHVKDKEGNPLFTEINFMHVKSIIQSFDKNTSFEDLLHARMQSAYKYAPRITVDRIAQEARQMYNQQKYDDKGNLNVDQQAETEIINKAFAKIQPYTYEQLQSIISQGNVNISMVSKRRLLGRLFRGEYKGIDLKDAAIADDIEQLESFVGNYGFSGLSAQDFEKYKPIFKDLGTKQWKQFQDFANNPVYEDQTGGFDPQKGFFITPWGQSVFESKNGKYWSVHTTPYKTKKGEGLIDTFDEWKPPSSLAYIANIGEIRQVSYVYDKGKWVEVTTKAIGYDTKGQMQYSNKVVPLTNTKARNPKPTKKPTKKTIKPQNTQEMLENAFQDLNNFGGGI